MIRRAVWMLALVSSLAAGPAAAIVAMPSGFRMDTLTPADGALLPLNARAFVWGDSGVPVTELVVTLVVGDETRTLTPIRHPAMFGVAYELPFGELPAGALVSLTLADARESLTVSYTIVDELDETPPVFREGALGDEGFEGQSRPEGGIAYDLWFSSPGADDDHGVAAYQVLYLPAEGVEEVVDTVRGGTSGDFGTEEVVAHALTFPEAWEDHPWGERVVKVKKKIFLFSSWHEGGFNFGMKLPMSGPVVLDLPFAKPSGYGLGKAGWVHMRLLDADAPPPIGLVREWLDESYRAVASVTLAKRLPPR